MSLYGDKICQLIYFTSYYMYISYVSMKLSDICK